jgi:hypothetical protein
MKKSIAGTMLLLACLFASCQKGANQGPIVAGPTTLKAGGNSKPVVIPPVVIPPIPIDNVASSLPIGDLISVGTWKVGSYFEKTKDKTDQFAAYTFTFTKTGQIRTNLNGIFEDGNWIDLTSNFYYGVPVDATSNGFRIVFYTLPLATLANNLYISKKTTTNFYLKSINPAEARQITFIKISN